MKEFLLVFRREENNNETPLSPEQLQAMMKPWQDWLGNMAAQNKLASPGNRLESDGRVIKSNQVVMNGPYVETKETVGGYSIIKADNFEDATEMAKSCPILAAGGSVEVRMIVSM